MSRQERHVVPNPNGGWSSKKNGAERSTKNFDTKKEAEEFSSELSEREGSELIIHGKDGKIQSASRSRTSNSSKEND